MTKLDVWPLPVEPRRRGQEKLLSPHGPQVRDQHHRERLQRAQPQRRQIEEQRKNRREGEEEQHQGV